MTRKRKAKNGLSVGVLIAAVVISAVLIVLGVRLFYNLALFRQHGTAAAVNGYSLTAADVNFFYYRSYYEYMNTVDGDTGTYGFGMKPDEHLPLSEQMMYSNDGKEVSWQSYFAARAEQLIRQTFLFYGLAQEAGFELSAEQQNNVNYDFEEKIWFEAEMAGQSVEEYLEAHYGKGMTEEIYRKNLEVLFLANDYRLRLQDSVEIPEEELDAAYTDGRNEYDIVFYRLFYLSGKAQDETEQGAKMEQAKKRAEELAVNVSTEEQFINLSKEYTKYNDEESYWEGADDLRREQIRYSLSYFRGWLSEPERQKGDTRVEKGENGYYIAMFLSRDDNMYETENLKYFSVSGKNAEKRTEGFFEAWKGGNAQTFFETAANYRDIDYNVNNRSMEVISYDRQSRASVPEVMLSWCFDELRENGDVARIEDDENRKTYVVYFDGYDMQCARSIVYKDLSRQKYQKWLSEALEAIAVEHRFCFRISDAA